MRGFTFSSSCRPFLRRLGQASLAVTLLTLVSCARVPLYSELDEAEANEVMSTLLQKNIPCHKVSGKEGKWILQVAPEDFPLAMSTLSAVGLPREKHQKMGEVFQKSGLISSPTEERIRYISALSQEIADTLMQIDGVLSARVHVALPENDPLAEETKPPSAAVFIKYRSGYDLESAMPDLKNLVTKSIEGLSFENVEVVMTQGTLVEPPPKMEEAHWSDRLPKWAVPTGTAVGGALLMGILFSLFHKRPTGPAKAT